MKKVIISLCVFLTLGIFSSASAEMGNTLSQNDQSFYNKIQEELGTNFVNSVEIAIGKYEDNMQIQGLNENEKIQKNIVVIGKIESLIAELLMKYPQDIALPTGVNQRYFILSYLKFELMMLDFSDTMSSETNDLKQRLSSVQFEVTQNGATEIPFTNKYFDNFEAGIYIDIVDGTVLFSSIDKFKTNTGWPAFSKPISESAVAELDDLRYNMVRIEVKGATSNSHLGHIFTDGPKDAGGLRYCINSASLEFIPKSELESRGYAEYLSLFE